MLTLPEIYRVTTGQAASRKGQSAGMFLVPQQGTYALRVIASAEMGWEHVSVSLPTRCPTWDEMKRVKDLFWDMEDCVLQFHPPESVYVNNHQFCLHLWRQLGVEVPLPPAALVGVKALGVIR